LGPVKKASFLIAHRFTLDRILEAYGPFANAANTRALKVIIEA
jgi:alcohol dehydrogenase